MRLGSHAASLLIPLGLALGISLVSAACGGSDAGSGGSTSSSSSGGKGGSGGSGEGGSGGGSAEDPMCDPLVPSFCGFPFPSNYYLAADSTKKTGHKVAFKKGSLPTRAGSGTLDVTTYELSDGFSPGQAPMTDLPGATVTGLPTQDTIEASLAADSPTILINADTGERVPHFAEIDESDAASDGDRAFMIRPVVRLADATRYIVAIRKVVDKDGKLIAPSDAFVALRDKKASKAPGVESRRDLYEDIFAKLKTAGVDREDLQIAWDYSTASRDNNTAAMVKMRDEALALVGADGPEYTIDSVDDAPNQYIYKRIHGHMTVPLYLDKAETGGKLVLGDDGLPKQNGTASFEFLVHLPNRIQTDTTPLAVLQNGHGLLGDKTEGQDGYLAEISEKNGFITFAVDFIGMAEEDTMDVENAIGSDISGFKQLVDRQHQGMLNSLLAMRMMKGRFGKDPLVQFNGKSMVDGTQSFYRGDSQGGIFGGSYMALSTDVTRGLLGEPGMPYNLLLNRSKDFAPFFSLLQIVYGNGRSIQQVLGLVQMMWDRTEPDGYVPYIVENMLPGTPQHQVLIHAAIGDQQVTPLGAEMVARMVKAKGLQPMNRPVYGITETPGPFTGSGLVEFSFGLPESPETNTPPTGSDDDDPHDKVRSLEFARDQAENFFRTGEIKAYCDGVCDPE